MNNIYQTITKVMADVGAVAKTDVNTFDKYKYRGIDAIYNALHPAMVKNRLFVVPEVLDIQRDVRESKKGEPLNYAMATVRYTFYAEDGSSIQAVVTGEGMDRGDKAGYKALTGAFKYACFQTLCLPTEEAQDPEIDSPQPVNEAPKEKQTEAEAAAAAYPSREEMINYIYSWTTKSTREEIEKSDDAALMATFAIYETKHGGKWGERK